MLKKIIIGVITLCMIGLIGYFALTVFAGGQSESRARDALETYLDLMKNGDTDKAGHYLEETDNLIDVFDYKYLNTTSEKEDFFRFYMTKSEYIDSPVFIKQYGTWNSFVDSINKDFGDSKNFVIKGTDDDISYYDKTDKKKVYKFLYDMQVANGLGNKLYKKIEFTVEYSHDFWDGKDIKDGFVITNIDIRGGDLSD